MSYDTLYGYDMVIVPFEWIDVLRYTRRYTRTRQVDLHLCELRNAEDEKPGDEAYVVLYRGSKAIDKSTRVLLVGLSTFRRQVNAMKAHLTDGRGTLEPQLAFRDISRHHR